MGKRNYRQHPLSHVFGGCVIRIIKENGHIEDHDLVKYPERYINEALDCNDLLIAHGIENKRTMIAEIYQDGELVWDTNDQDESIIPKKPTSINKKDAKKMKENAARQLKTIKQFAKRRK